MRHINTETMSLALDGLLEDSEERAFYLHLSGCTQCRGEWQIWQAIEQKFNASPLMLPTAGFVQRWEQSLTLAEARHDLVLRRAVSTLALLGTGLWLWAALSLFMLLSGGLWVATHPTLAADLIHGARLLVYSLGYLLRGIQQLLTTLLLGPGGVLLLASLVMTVTLTLTWLKVVPGFGHVTPDNLEAR